MEVSSIKILVSSPRIKSKAKNKNQAKTVNHSKKLERARWELIK